MRCEEALELIGGYLDNENTDSEQAQLLEHLEHCEACRQVLESFRQADENLISAMQEVPEDLHGKIMDEIRALSAPKKKKTRWMGLAASAAAVALAIGLYGISNGAPMTDAAMPMEARVVMESQTTMEEPMEAPAMPEAELADEFAYSMLDVAVEGKAVCEEYGAPVVVLHEAVQELEGLSFEILSDGTLLFTLSSADDAERLSLIYGATVYLPIEPTAQVSYALVITEK